MSKSILRALATSCCVIFTLSVSACGGGGTPADTAAVSGSPPADTTAVSGLATASSVTAVSAKN